MPSSAAVATAVGSDQTAAVQKSPGDRSTRSVTPDSAAAAQNAGDRVADEQSQQSQDAGGDSAKSKTKSKWRVW